MKAITEKMLRSGLIDGAMVQVMEKMGMLEEGASEMVKEEALKNAPIPVLHKFADDMAELLEREHAIKETMLDLKAIKWPVSVTVKTNDGHTLVNEAYKSVKDVPAVMDDMGRYYFRYEDAQKSWFVPGYLLSRVIAGKLTEDTISESQVLYTNEEPVCYQVSVLQ